MEDYNRIEDTDNSGKKRDEVFSKAIKAGKEHTFSMSKQRVRMIIT